MPELVTCPTCGFRVQVSEVQLGKVTRCIACDHRFTAHAESSTLIPAGQAPTYPVRAEELAPASSPPAAQPKGAARHRLPLCPACHRPVGWEALACPYCGHLFDPLDPEEAEKYLRRRDREDHRGRLIHFLGGISLAFGTLSLCVPIAGTLLAMGFGVGTLILAQRDLQRMQTGLVDPTGRPQTERGRIMALVGIVLGLLLGLVWVFLIVG